MTASIYKSNWHHHSSWVGDRSNEEKSLVCSPSMIGPVWQHCQPMACTTVFDGLPGHGKGGGHPSRKYFSRQWSGDVRVDTASPHLCVFWSNSCRSSRTQTSPVGTSCRSSRRFAGPLLSSSFFMVATGTSVRPRKSVGETSQNIHQSHITFLVIAVFSPGMGTLHDSAFFIFILNSTASTDPRNQVRWGFFLMLSNIKKPAQDWVLSRKGVYVFI